MLSFSGVDSAGKSTQIELVKQYYRKKGIKHKAIWGRAGSTPGISFVKGIVLKHKKIDAKDRAEYRQSIHSSSKKKNVLLIATILDVYWYFGVVNRFYELLGYEVIWDRYIWDSYCDMKIAYPHDDFENWTLWKLLLKFIPFPRKSFVFIISAEEAKRRDILKADQFSPSIATNLKKIEIYNKLISEGKWDYVIDGNQSIEEISDYVMDVLGE